MLTCIIGEVLNIRWRNVVGVTAIERLAPDRKSVGIMTSMVAPMNLTWTKCASL